MRSLALGTASLACLVDWALHEEDHGIGEKSCQEDFLPRFKVFF
jgi:hypothetical protein